MEITVNMQLFQIFLLTGACTFSLIGLICGTLALIKVIAMEKSTHTMQYVSPDEIKDYTQEENTAKWDLDSNGEPSWATSDSVIDEQEKKYRKELEESGMDFFLPSDDEKKPYSF